MVWGGVYILKKIALSTIAFIFISIIAHATSLYDIKLEILSSVAHGLLGNKNIAIYLTDNSFIQKAPKKKVFGLEFVNDCNKADLIVGKSFKGLSKSCLEKCIFATNYNCYQQPNVLGALFWQKGRPVLILKKSVVEKKHINIGHSLERYLQ